MSAVSTWCFVPQTFDSILLVPESFLCFAFKRVTFCLRGDLTRQPGMHVIAQNEGGSLAMHGRMQQGRGDH